MTDIKRNLHYVDPTIRKQIISKIVFYWGACLVFSTLPLIIGTTLAQSDRLFVDHIGDLAKRYWPLYLIFMGILPFAIRDALRLTNRTLGPLARLRDQLAEYKKSGNYSPIICRDGDFLSEMIGDINSALGGISPTEQDDELVEIGA